MNREEKIKFIRWAIWEIEGVRVFNEDFVHKTDEELDKDIKWYEYLLTK